MPAIFGRGVSAVYQVQSAFDVFPSSGNWYPLSAYDLSAGETEPREVDPLLGRGGHNRRDPVASAPGLPQGGGNIVVPMCLREHGYWLGATLGAAETSVSSGVYTHVWESGKDALLPLAQSMKLADGMFRRSRGLLVNAYALNLAKEAGYPRATLGMMLRDQVRNASQASGTVQDAFELLRPPASTPFVEINTGSGFAALPATAVAFNYANQLQRFDPLNGTKYPSALDPEDSLPTGSFTIRYESDAYDVLAEAGTPFALRFGYVIADALTGSADASITFELARCMIDKNALPINSPGRLSQTYNYTVEQTDDDPAFNVTLVNDVAGYPPPPPPPPPPP